MTAAQRFPPPVDQGKTWTTDRPVQVAYGVRGPGGRLQQRPSPVDRAVRPTWPQQLDRLSDHWNERLTDDHHQTALPRVVAAALVEAGFDLHDCAGVGCGSTAWAGCAWPRAHPVAPATRPAGSSSPGPSTTGWPSTTSAATRRRGYAGHEERETS